MKQLKQSNELLEAAEYLGNAAIMLEETVSEKELDLEQLYNDQQLIIERAKRVYWVIEAALRKGKQ